MSKSFWAAAFETANALLGSPCAVGMAHVVNGKFAETRKMLITPGPGVLAKAGGSIADRIEDRKQ